MNILDQIQVNFQNFFESEKKIAEFILKKILKWLLTCLLHY